MIFKFHDTHVLRDAKIIDICEERFNRRLAAAKAEAMAEAEFQAERQRRWEQYKKDWLRPTLRLVPKKIDI